MMRVAIHRLEHDAFEVARNLRIESVRRQGITLGDLRHQLRVAALRVPAS